MARPTDSPPLYARGSFRIITGLVGACAAGAGMAVLWLRSPEHPLLAVALGVVLLALGVQAVIAAVRAREPWIGRIGPLP